MPKSSKWQDLPTEAINPNSLAMDHTSTDEIVELMLGEDRKVVTAVNREKARIAMGADLVTEAVRKGGRLIFVGAGTSGRLGVLEAAEMIPTFSTPPRLVQAIMAGGRSAFFHAKEGVEDNYEEGAKAVTRLRPTRRDVLIGVSASGMTQFVRGALSRARRSGVKIISSRAGRVPSFRPSLTSSSPRWSVPRSLPGRLGSRPARRPSSYSTS